MTTKKDLKDLMEGIAESQKIDLKYALPGLGMIVHGLAAAVVDATTPPDSFIKLKEQFDNEDKRFTQQAIEEEHPEVAKEMESIGEKMGELVHQCQRILDMSPNKIVNEAIELAKHHEKARAKKAEDKEDMSFSDAKDDVDAPLDDGWQHNTKGNA